MLFKRNGLILHVKGIPLEKWDEDEIDEYSKNNKQKANKSQFSYTIYLIYDLDMTEKEIDQKKEKPEVKKFSVPFSLEEKQENITITTNTPKKLSKEQIFNKAINFHLQGNIQEAAKYYQYFINQGFKDQRVFSNYGLILRDLGNLKEAELSLNKAIELKPKNTRGIMNRFKLFFDQGKFELALKDADSCNTKESRASALETLYALGRIDEIYKRIEKTSTLDDGNIRLAAFSSFISEQEKKDTSNNFCRTPLSFLYFSNLKFHCKDYIDFSRKIIDDLSTIKTVCDPLNKTTRNGFQTPTHINLFSKSSQNISHLKSIILNELDAYYSKFEKESCSYIQKWPSNKNLEAWHVILKKQGYQNAHIHTSGWLSGVIYLKVVPNLDKNEGAIEFSLNGEHYSNKNSSQLIHQPELGDMVFFPSSLHHRTIPFSTDTDRIVIAFDLKPN